MVMVLIIVVGVVMVVIQKVEVVVFQFFLVTFGHKFVDIDNDHVVELLLREIVMPELCERLHIDMKQILLQVIWLG